jgi:hypothetical protein
MEIKVDYTLTKKQWLEGFDKYESTTAFFKIDYIISILFILIGLALIFYFYSIYNLIIGILIIIFSLFSLLTPFKLSRYIVGLQFKNNPKSKYMQSVIFNDNGLMYNIQNVKSEIAWDYYNKFLETNNLIILIYGPRQYSIFPKNSFTEFDLRLFIDFCMKRFNK